MSYKATEYITDTVRAMDAMRRVMFLLIAVFANSKPSIYSLHSIDIELFPNALCLDGSPAAFWHRPGYNLIDPNPNPNPNLIKQTNNPPYNYKVWRWCRQVYHPSSRRRVVHEPAGLRRAIEDSVGLVSRVGAASQLQLGQEEHSL